MSDQSAIRVTVWNEFRHETLHDEVKRIYPDGIHAVIAEHLRSCGMAVHTATLDEPEHGLTQDVLTQTDVLIWWGHIAHQEVQEAVVGRVQACVWDGMGLLVLHSGHESKVFKRLMGTSCDLKWREAAEKERVWVAEPGHPIVDGLEDYIELPHSEMYGEPFQIPNPEHTVFISWFEGGEVFRSGCTFSRGRGHIFYFGPGHETYPIYYDPNVLRVITNAVRWLTPRCAGATISYRHHLKPIEPIRSGNGQ